MKKVLLWLLAIALTAGALFLLPRGKPRPAEAQGAERVEEAFRLLQSSLGLRETFFADLDAPPALGPFHQEALPDRAAPLNYQDSAAYQLAVPTEGWYALSLAFKPESPTLSDFGVALDINGEAAYAEMGSLLLPLSWSDESKVFPKDSYGDESMPAQVRLEGFRTVPLRGMLHTTAGPLLFPLKAGANTVRVRNVSNDGLLLGALSAYIPEEAPAYADYRAWLDAREVTESIAINAVDYRTKNSSQVMLLSENNPALTPHDPAYKKLNVLRFTEPGSAAVFSFTAPQSGDYALTLRLKNKRQDISAFMSFRIDGALPFAEAANVPLPDTGARWVNHTLADNTGAPWLFRLAQGAHTLEVTLEMEPLMRSWRLARLLSEHVTRLSLDITKVAGSQTDRNRTWQMTRYIPDIPKYLDAYRVLMEEMRGLLSGYSGGDGAALLTELDKAGQFLSQVSAYPDEIALYLESLTGRDNSILASLTNFTTALNQNELSLNMIYLGGGEAPPARAGLLPSLNIWLATLTSSFTTQKYKPAGITAGTLDIWVNRALTHVDVLQKMADTGFTAETGIKVKVSAMPDAGKLTLSAAAGQAPDAALGLASYMPFDLASRGALYDLSRFPDFWQVAGRFTPGAMVPYLFNEGVFALPETMDFNALVYRRDIFDSLGLTVPDTWEQVVGLLPQLQRYGMNFYHNIASGFGYKWFYQTTPFIYQHGGSLYTPDGTRTAIDRPEAVAGIQALGNLFLAYSLDKQVNSFFNSFRYSVLPVGIIDSAEYILLKNGAPELQGRWALAPYPGTADAEGNIQRWYVSNGQGGIIFKDSELAEEAWAFLKWWTRADTQVTYGHTLRSTYGDAFLWLPANLQALGDAPIERADKDIILQMAPWLRDVPRSPGQYLVERSISDIWNAMISRGVSAQVAADEKVIAINREIRKKLQELGFADAEGKLLRPYVVRDIDWISQHILFSEGGAP